MKWYKLIFKQNQPIHIGSTKWGVVNKTEIFIPGWTMWGALTKTFNQYSKSKLSDNQELFETITCFYPSFDKMGNNILFPEYKNGLLYLREENLNEKEYSEDKFRYEFTDTFVSTAIVPGTRSAKDESLHEIEILLPQGKKENESLYWVGVLGINNDLPSFIKKGLNIYIGGDIKYGLGELQLHLDPELKNSDFLEGWNINSNGYLSFNNNKNIKQFLEFSPEIKFEGELKLLAEFDFTKNTPEVKKAGYFIDIGSKINNNKITNQSYKLVKGKFEKVGS